MSDYEATRKQTRGSGRHVRLRGRQQAARPVAEQEAFNREREQARTARRRALEREAQQRLTAHLAVVGKPLTGWCAFGHFSDHQIHAIEFARGLERHLGGAAAFASLAPSRVDHASTQHFARLLDGRTSKDGIGVYKSIAHARLPGEPAISQWSALRGQVDHQSAQVARRAALHQPVAPFSPNAMLCYAMLCYAMLRSLVAAVCRWTSL
jgi:hypothetical protein